MRIGLREVAERAGVSESTVSRVVNDRPGVKDETRVLVRRIIEDMGYEQAGLRLDTASDLVGLIVPELQNPIFPAFAQAIESDLAGAGYTCVVCTEQRGGQEQSYLEALVERGVAGMIVVSGLNANAEVDHGIYTKQLGRGLPMVFVNGYVEGLDATFVSADEHYAAGIAVRHLASLGHRRIGAVMGPRQFVPVQRRTEGYREAMRAVFGAGDDHLIADGFFSVQGGHAAAIDLLDLDCTALICASDLMALGAIRAAVERGLDVPGDVSVIGYDDTILMEFVDPPLTTIRQPVRAISQTVVQVLVERIAGAPVRRREYLFRPELVVRGSIGPVRAADTAAERRRR